jgi:hypothetical protein
VSNIVESKTEIQVDVPLTEETKRKCAGEMLEAMKAITLAINDIKDYQTEQKEELKKYESIISQARSKATEFKLSDDEKLTCAMDIITALNAMSVIEDDLNVHKTQRQFEIAKNEAVVNICRTKINRGRDFKWIEVKVIKNFDKKTKTFADLKTGEILKTLPMSDEDLQLPMAE